MRALGDVVQSDAFASQALNRHLVEAGLKENDRRLATGLFYSALENRLYIGHILDRFVERRPEPRINDVLHIAVAQLLFMDRVPDHAAVDEAVGQVRNMHLEGYAGMVNGVLRNVIRARDAGALNLTDLEADPIAWLSVRYSLALPAAKRLVEAYGFEEAKSIAAWTPVRREQSIRANRERMDAASFEAWLESQKFNWRKGAVTGAYIVTDGGDLSTHAGYRQGLFSIQGQSAMLAGMAVEAKPGMQILDACAAPGGKTCLMAEQMGTSGRVYAWDIYPHRVALIRAAARRLGLENVRPVERDARKPMESMDLTMDAVLVDAPCSGLGMIAEKPDIKYRQTDEGLKDLPRLQRQILEAASRAVKIGGTLVYATCTVLPEENEQVVRAFLEAHSEFEPLPGGDWLPKTLLPRLSEGMLQILPHRDGLEGFFIARMYRKGM
ncbi:MAG: 16S rRNA (cytosine(967)-C(5))-methyltransferase RsmB [Clostridia bacterium]|nr:16S rRNA (cytosine(967)-C(5))-methyltransferase RsmB [Clostridia bacterium]